MAQLVTDPELLRLLNQAPTPKAGSRPVTDPNLLAQLNAEPIKGDPTRWNAQGDAVDMLSFGLANKGLAGAQGIYDSLSHGGTLSENYDRRLAQLRADQEAFGKEHPIAKRVGQGTGVVLGALAAPGVTVAKGIGMAPRIANAALTGLGYGTLAGAAEDAESLVERVGNTAAGAAWGTALGAAAAPVAVGAGKLANKSWEWLRNQFTAQMPKVDRTAITTVLQQMQASGMTPRQAWLKLQELGPEGMLADVSPNMQTAMAGAALRSPEAQTLVAERLAQRRAGGHGRIEEDLNRTLGPARDPFAIKQGAKAVQNTTRDAYRSASGYEVDTKPVADFVQQEILKVGPRGPWGSTLQQIRSIVVDDAGNLVSNGARVHAIREQLDIMAEGARNSGQGKLAAKIGEVRGLVDKSLKQGVPGFAEADRTFATEARKIERFEQGRRKALSKEMSPEELSSIIDNPNIPVPEKQMLVSGARWNIGESLSSARNDSAAALDRIGRRNMNAAKIETLTGSPRAADRLQKAIEREATFTETSNLGEPARQSRTAILQSAKEQFGDPTKPSLFSDVAQGATAGGLLGGGTGALAGAGAGASRNIAVRVGQALKGRANEAVIKRTADMLTSVDPQLQSQVLSEIERRLARIPKSRQTEKTVERIVGGVLISAGVRIGPPDTYLPNGLIPQLSAP